MLALQKRSDYQLHLKTSFCYVCLLQVLLNIPIPLDLVIQLTLPWTSAFNSKSHGTWAFNLPHNGTSDLNHPCCHWTLTLDENCPCVVIKTCHHQCTSNFILQRLGDKQIWLLVYMYIWKSYNLTCGKDSITISSLHYDFSLHFTHDFSHDFTL